MNIQIFGKAKCFDTKKAERYFKERRIKYQYVDLSKFGISKGELRSVKTALRCKADDLLDQQLAAAVETSDRYASIDTALEEQMAGDEVLKRIEARVKEAINAQTAEKTEFAMTCDETVLSTLEAARTGHEQLVELRSELEALSTFVKGITAYTEGVDQAAQGMQQLHEGLKQLSDGAQTLADGAGTLYAQGTKVLRQTLTDLQKNLAEKLLPYVHNEAREAVSTYEEVRDSVGKLDFDLQGEDMKCVLVTIVRTDLKK